MCGGRHHQPDSSTGYAPGLMVLKRYSPSLFVTRRACPEKLGSSGALWRSISWMYLPAELACQSSRTQPDIGRPSSSVIRPETEISWPTARALVRERSAVWAWKRSCRFAGPVRSLSVSGRLIRGREGTRVKLLG